MTLSAGRTVWIPCEVKPGPFSNERLVRVEGDPQRWVGFVPIWYLRAAIERGRTEVRAVVAEMRGEQFLAASPDMRWDRPSCWSRSRGRRRLVLSKPDLLRYLELLSGPAGRI